MIKTKAGDIVGNDAPRILRRRAVEAATGLSRSTIYSRMSAGSFPKPIPLGGGRVGWLESEIRSWIAERQRERDRAAA